MNIVLRIFDAAGNAVSSEIIVNQPNEDPPIEQTLASQESPAVDFDSSGRLVVVWFGPTLIDCGNFTDRHVFVRQLTWTPGNDPAALGPEFIADVADNFKVDPVPNPTVAFSQAEGREGQFVVMWNAYQAVPVGLAEVHARAFDWQTFALGNEFRIHPATDTVARRLANSAQHTCTWSAQDRITAAWTKVGSPQDVNVTILPPG